MGDEKKKEKAQAVEVICPKCKHTEIVYIPTEPVPECPKCKIPMTVKEILTEGKSY